jgi:hypothetical protein
LELSEDEEKKEEEEDKKEEEVKEPEPDYQVRKDEKKMYVCSTDTPGIHFPKRTHSKNNPLFL